MKNLTNFHIDQLARTDFENAIDKEGYAIVEGVFTGNEMDAIGPEIEEAITKEANYHGTKEYDGYGMLLACPIYGGKFIELLNNPNLYRPVDWLLGESAILWVYTTSCLPPHSGNFANRIHVDRPHFIPGFLDGLGTLICVSDITTENGATRFLPGSHTMIGEPDVNTFEEQAIPLLASKGSVFYFNLRLWHRGGINQTNDWRHMLGMGFIRPYLKQRIDLPRATAHLGLLNEPELVLQKLGYFAQPPASLDEFYGKNTSKSYRQKSEWDK